MNLGIPSLYTLHIQGLMGCIITSVNHGLSSSALFMLPGFLYDRTHSRNIFTLQTLFNHYPISSTFTFFILILGNISIPGTLNFLGELLTILSFACVDLLLSSLFGAIAILLTTCYSLILYKRICFGKRSSLIRKVLLTIQERKTKR